MKLFIVQYIDSSTLTLTGEKFIHWLNIIILGQPAIGSVDPVYMQSPNMTCRVQEERQKAKREAIVLIYLLCKVRPQKTYSLYVVLAYGMDFTAWSWQAKYFPI